MTTLKRIPGYSFIENPTEKDLEVLEMRLQAGEIADIKDAHLPDIVFFKRAKRAVGTARDEVCSIQGYRLFPGLTIEETAILDRVIDEAPGHVQHADRSRTVPLGDAILYITAAFLIGGLLALINTTSM